MLSRTILTHPKGRGTGGHTETAHTKAVPTANTKDVTHLI